VARSPRDWFAPQAKLPCAVARFWPASSWPLQAAWAKPDLWSAFASTASYVMWSARLEMCQWRRETLDKESIWDEARSTNLSRW